MDDFNLPDFNIDFGNFDPLEITSDEIINAIFLVDIFPSVESYIHELNNAFKEFLEEMQRSHIAEKLMVSIIEFNDKVTVRTDFQPVNSIDLKKMKFTPCGYGAALYDAVLYGLTNAVNYRANLENSGVNCKTLIFTITNGEDNASKNSAAIVKNGLDVILNEEKNAFNFEKILFGVGNDLNFEATQKELGIKCLAQIGNPGKEIRKMIGFISASISQSSSANNQVVF